MKSNIKKWFGIYTLLITALVISCEKEISTHEHEESKINKVNLTEIPEIADLLKPETRDMGRNHTMGILDSIAEEDVIVIEKEDGTKSYTFALTITEPVTQMTNLVIEETDEGYKYFTVTYESDNMETWVSQVNSMQETTVQVEITKNDLVDFSARGGDCESIEIQAVCPSGQHDGTDFASCDFHRNQWSYMVVFKVVPCTGSSGGGSSGGGGGSSSGSTSGTTSPNVKTPMFFFISSLSPEQRTWWANVQNISAKIPMITFLNKNNHSLESENYTKELINYALANNNSPEALQEIKNILDILDDGLLGGQPVVVGPDLPITNMAEYLSTFNTSQPAVITLYADQPTTGSHFPFTVNSAKAGHAFITIKQGTKVRSFGFYPQNTLASGIPNPITIDPTDFLPTPSSFGNDQGHDFDVSISKPITATQLSNTINGIIAIFQSNPPYNLGSLNCVDFAITVFESNTNINIPSAESPGPWNGQTPATLGQVLRTMTLPTGATKNITGGSAPSNNSN